MKNYTKGILAGLLLSGGVMTLSAGNTPSNDVRLNEPVTKSSLTDLIYSVEANVQDMKSLKGYKYEGTSAEYSAHPGLVNDVKCNAPNARGSYRAAWMFDKKVRSTGKDDFRTEGDPSRLDANNKGKRHWIQFDLKNKYNDIVLKFTCTEGHSENGIWGNRRPTKIMLLAPKPGEKEGIHDSWTDTLAIEKSIATYRGKYDNNPLEDSTTYVGHFKFDHDIQKLRMVVLEVNNDPKSSTLGWGPVWSLTEMSIHDGNDWYQENVFYKAFDQQQKDLLKASLEKAKTAVNADPAGYAEAYNNLSNTYNEFYKTFQETYPTEALFALIKTATNDVSKRHTVGNHSMTATLEDYKKDAGLVNGAEGNADNANGYYKPQWMFDNEIYNPDDAGHHYTTEWDPGRLPANMRDKRHWVQFDVKHELTEMVMKFTNINDGKKNAGVTGIMWLAPKEGEKLGKYDIWTDTLYEGKVAATYPTFYTSGQFTDSTTFIGKFAFPHPVKNIRLVVTETGNDPNTSKAKSGPSWKMAEMRLYETKSWEETETYKSIAKEITTGLQNALVNARRAYANMELTIKDSYLALKKAHQDFITAYNSTEQQAQLNQKLTTLVTDAEKFVADVKFNTEAPFYMYMSGAEGANIQSIINKAKEELAGKSVTAETCTNLETAFNALKEQITPAVAMAFWNNYKFDDFGTAIKTPELAAVLDALNGMKDFVAADWVKQVDEFNRLFVIDYPAPAVGSFFRIKASKLSGHPGFYMTSTTAIDGGNPFRTQFKEVTDADTDASVIFYVEEGGQLRGYANGNLLHLNAGLTFRTIYVDDYEYNNPSKAHRMLPVKFTYSKAAAEEAGAYNLKYNGSYDKKEYLVAIGNKANSKNVCVEVAANTVTPRTNFNLEKVNSLPVKVSAAKYASLYTPVALNIPTDVKAYTGKRAGNMFQLQEITSGVIPANTAVILTAEEGLYSFAISKEAAEPVEGNELQGQTNTDYEKTEIFTLQNQNNVVGLYPFDGRKNYEDKVESHKFVNGFKAYLPETAAVNVLKFSFGDEATGIEGVETENEPTVYYDLNGRRVFYPTHGVYITGEGKKVLIP